MQRGILFLLFISSFLRLTGQRNAASVELALQYDSPPKLECKALVQASDWSLSTKLQLQQAQNLKIYLIKAGSRKALNFNYDGQEVSLTFSSLPHPLAQLELHYYLEKEFLETKEAWTFLEAGFLLNDFNMGENSALQGEEGLLFPCFSGEQHFWSLNLIVPENWEISSPFMEEYRIDLKGRVAHYFASAKAQSPASLYLAAGLFKSDKAEEILEEAEEILERLETEGEIVRVREEERLIAIMQNEHAKLLEFLAVKREEPWKQKDLEGLLELSKRQDELYLKHEMLPKVAGTKKHFLAEQRILINAAESLEQASRWQEEFYQKRFGPDYLDEYLHGLYRAQAMQAEHSWHLFLNRYLASQNLSLADTLQLADTSLTLSQREYLSTAASMYQKRKPISLSLTYQYSYPRKQMRFRLSQADSNLYAQVGLEVLAIGATDSTDTSFTSHLNLSDTLRWPLSGAPRSINVDLKKDKWNFFTLDEQRPEAYYLYDFSKSSDPQKKRKALLALLETRNANLLATVMGIAIDSGEKELQILALDKAKKLNTLGKQKLRESIKVLAEESKDVKLKQKAAEAYKIISP